VRLLSDFETPRAKLLQIILAGQPELAEKLSHPGLSQLRQRITSFNGLKPFPAEQTARFIDHRLRVAGYEGATLFDAEAVALISELSEGIPRNINNLCFHSLSLAFAMQQKTVDLMVVQEVADDLDIRRLLTDEHSSTRLGLDMDYRQEWDGERTPSRTDSHAQLERIDSGRSMSGQSISGNGDLLSPDEARAHMQEVTRFLKNWQGVSGSKTGRENKRA
jgi:hypothetical protein